MRRCRWWPSSSLAVAAAAAGRVRFAVVAALMLLAAATTGARGALVECTDAGGCCPGSTCESIPFTNKRTCYLTTGNGTCAPCPSGERYESQTCTPAASSQALVPPLAVGKNTSIEAARIEVCSPAPALLLERRKVRTDWTLPIRWNSYNVFTPTTVKITIKQNSDVVETIAEKAINDGAYDWSMNTISNTIVSQSLEKTNFRIVVQSNDDPLVSHESEPFDFLFVDDQIVFNWTEPFAGRPEASLSTSLNTSTVIGSTTVSTAPGSTLNMEYPVSACRALYRAEELGLRKGEFTTIRKMRLRVDRPPPANITRFRVSYYITKETSLADRSFASESTFLNELALLRRDKLNRGAWFELVFREPVKFSFSENVVFEFSHTGQSVGSGSSVLKQENGTLSYVAVDSPRRICRFAEVANPQAPFETTRSLAPAPMVPVVQFEMHIGEEQRFNTGPDCGVVTTQTLFSGAPWNELSSRSCDDEFVPECRSGSSTFFLDGALYTFGGLGLTQRGSLPEAFNDLWRFDITSKTWTRLQRTDCVTSDRPACRYLHSSTLLGDGYVYVFGGRTVDGAVVQGSELMWRLNVTTLEWKSVNQTTRVRACHSHAAAAWGERLVISGGIGVHPTTGASVRSDQLLVWDAPSDSWTDKTVATGCCLSFLLNAAFCDERLFACEDSIAEMRCYSGQCVSRHSMVISGDTAYIFGGARTQSDPPVLSNALWSRDLTATSLFSRTVLSAEDCGSSSLPACRMGHVSAVVNNKLVIVGGSTDRSVASAANDVWQFDLALQRWELLSLQECFSDPSYPACVSDASGTAVVASGGGGSTSDNVLLMFGGRSYGAGSLAYHNSLWMLGEAPFVFNVDPRVPVTAGAVVTILGDGFGADTAYLAVTVGELECSNVTLVQANAALTCQLPEATGSNPAVVVARRLGTILFRSNPASRVQYALPVVSSLNATDGKAGDALFVTGSNFGPLGSVPRVLIGTFEALNVRRLSQTSLELVVPEGVGGNLPVQVVVGDQGSLASSAAQRFSYPAPQVTSVVIDPQAGGQVPTSGGTLITIFGQGFGSGGSGLDVSVRIGDKFTATNTTYVSGTQLTCVMPPGGGSNEPVVVTVNGRSSSATAATAAARISYSRPVIRSVTAPIPPLTLGNTYVTVSGINFGGPGSAAEATVALNQQPCKKTEVVTVAGSGGGEQQLQCTAPEGVGTALIATVSVEGLRSAAFVSDVSYQRPLISEVSPDPVDFNQNARITITGSAFGPYRTAIRVRLGDRDCTTVNVEDTHAQISCSVSLPGEPGTLPLVVEVGGQESRPYMYRVRLPPISDGLKSAMSAMAGVLIALYVCLMGSVYHYRDWKVIKAASVPFSLLILIGGIVAVSSVFTTHIKEGNGCMLSTWQLLIGFTLLYGSLLVKNLRVLILFRSKKLMRIRILKDYELLGMIMVPLAVSSLLLGLLQSQSECGRAKSDGARACLGLLMAMQAFILASGVVVAWRSRDIQIAEFKERNQIGAAIYNVAFSSIVLLPIVFALEKQVIAIYVLQCTSAMFVTTVTLLILFVPKFAQVFAGVGAPGSKTAQTSRTTTAYRSKNSSDETSRTGAQPSQTLTHTGFSGRLAAYKGKGPGPTFHSALPPLRRKKKKPAEDAAAPEPSVRTRATIAGRNAFSDATGTQHVAERVSAAAAAASAATPGDEEDSRAEKERRRSSMRPLAADGSVLDTSSSQVELVEVGEHKKEEEKPVAAAAAAVVIAGGRGSVIVARKLKGDGQSTREAGEDDDDDDDVPAPPFRRRLSLDDQILVASGEADPYEYDELTDDEDGIELGGGWIQFIHDESGVPYFFHQPTGRTVWRKPAELT